MYINKRKEVFKNLWIEKYRPSKLDDLIMDQQEKIVFQQMINKQEIPHLLLAGKPGTGKTTLAFILINNIIGNESDVLELNGSVARGIDIIRNQIEEYCKSPPFNSKIKIVFIDEADKLTPDAQDALRNIIETYSENVRFIFTCNYIHKISDALKSRLQTFLFKALPKEEIYKIISSILNNENVIFQENDLKNLIDLTYPDIRKLINEIQKFVLTSNNNVKQLVLRTSNGSYFIDEIAIVEDIINLWRLVPQSKNNQLVTQQIQNIFNNIVEKCTINVISYETIYRILFDRVNGLGTKAIISEYANKNDKVLFQDMNLVEMIYKVMNIIQKFN